MGMSGGMADLDRILIATDGSHCARVAARVGIALAREADATVDAVSVIDSHVVGDDTRHRAERDRVRDALDDVGQVGAEMGVVVRTDQRSGDPPTEITDAAKAIDADLIVVGRHGRRGLGDRLLGSVTDRVLRAAPVPVLVAPATSLLTLSDRPDFDRVLACTDGSEAADTALDPARLLASVCGCRVDVLGVVEVSELYRVLPNSMESAEVDRVEAAMESATEEFAAAVAPSGNITVEAHLRRGVPHEEIVEFVKGNSIDLVVMASRGQTRLGGRLIGSVTNRVLRVVDAPVLVIPVSE